MGDFTIDGGPLQKDSTEKEQFMEKRRTETTRPEASCILSERRSGYAPMIFAAGLIAAFCVALIFM